MKPIAIDLYAGLGGWAEGFLAAGYDVVGFDIERHDYGTGGYPGWLVLQDVLTLHGSQFRDAAVIVASPPCQAYSYRAMPWKRAKALPPPDNTLFEACFRIQHEACEAAGLYIPLVVENVRVAQPWVGKAVWRFGSYFLWGDVPALMPRVRAVKRPGMNWSGSDKPGYKAEAFNAVTLLSEIGRKVSINFHEYEKTGRPGRSFQSAAVVDCFGWSKDTPLRDCNSKSPRRKAASAQIAKIPFTLAYHIAQVYYPQPDERTA